MLCDAPTNYLKEEECTKFIAAIPTVWNQTLPISGKVGEHIVMAREKDGIWYVGGLTDWKERDVEVDLSFLVMVSSMQKYLEMVSMPIVLGKTISVK